MDALIGLSVEDPRVVAAADAMGVAEMVEEGDRTHFDFPSHGVLWSVNASGILTTIFMRPPAEPPYGLRFGVSRAEVRQRLGDPTLWHETDNASPAWDRFDRSAYCIHAQYGEAGLEILTLMPPQPDPRML
ncbi:MAG: hypothetical protein ACYCW6_13205 [Candidatus Xenobia bacterium]